MPESAPFVNCSLKGDLDWARINDYPGIKMSPTDLNLIRQKLANLQYIVVDQWLDEIYMLFEMAILFE